jgi:hypothetical protein
MSFQPIEIVMDVAVVIVPTRLMGCGRDGHQRLCGTKQKQPRVDAHFHRLRRRGYATQLINNLEKLVMT